MRRRSSQVGLPETGRKTLALVIGVVLLAIVGWADYYTGPQLDFALFYLLPVGFVTWFAGTRAGLFTSALCAFIWLVVDRLTGAKSDAPVMIYSNLTLRLVFFACSVLLVGIWKHSQKTLSMMVERRTSALRKLASQLSEAEDAQRRKLAYDMHDALSQSLSLIRINLDAAQLQTTAQPQLQERLADVAALIDEVIKQTRTLMFDLHPAMLDDLGLVPTLQWYAQNFEKRTGAELIVSEQGSQRALPTALANYLFRAVKELVGNAIHHGRAREIIVVTHWEAQAIRLVVDDDGCGFDVAAVHSADSPRGLGLAGISERLQSMGGQLRLESKPGQGARAILEAPLHPAQTSEKDDYAISAAG